jgi:predicted CXXCH cytochrome family protein
VTSVGKVGGVNTIFGLSADSKTIRPGDAHEDFFVLAPDLHPDGETVKGQAMQYNDYITSRHAHSLTTLKNAEGRQDFCLMCHSTDFVLAEEGEEPTLETALHDIECALCHDSHGTEFENNLRVDKWDTCVQCHRNGDRVPGEAPLPPHKEVLMGDIPIDGLEGEPWMDGKALCTDCHMAPMAVREVPYDIPSHTWYFVSPAKSIDLGMPNSCTVACHGDDTPGATLTDEEALAYIEDKSALIEDLLEDAEVAVAQAEDAIAGAEDLGFTLAEIEAANATYINAEFALEFIHEDKSMIHNPSFQMDVLNYSIEKGDEIVAALLPGRVQGFVKDADGKAVQYAEIRMGDMVWGNTSGDGSFDFAIAPGDYNFDVYEGDKREASFSATVTAGDTTDAGTVKFKAESEETDNTMYILIALVVVIVLILVAVMMARRSAGEQ